MVGVDSDGVERCFKLNDVRIADGPRDALRQSESWSAAAEL